MLLLNIAKRQQPWRLPYPIDTQSLINYLWVSPAGFEPARRWRIMASFLYGYTLVLNFHLPMAEKSFFEIEIPPVTNDYHGFRGEYLEY